jgi:hypothetical protein
MLLLNGKIRANQRISINSAQARTYRPYNTRDFALGDSHVSERKELVNGYL